MARSLFPWSFIVGFFFFLLLESQGSVPRPGRQKSWGLYRPRVQDVHTFTSSMFYWSKQVWRPVETQSNEKPARNCGRIEPTKCNTPWHHLEFGSPCSKVLLSYPDHPSIYTDIHLFKPSSPWLLHLPTLFLTIFFFSVNTCDWSEQSCHLSSSFLVRELDEDFWQAWNLTIRKKSHNKNGLAGCPPPVLKL